MSQIETREERDALAVAASGVNSQTWIEGSTPLFAAGWIAGRDWLRGQELAAAEARAAAAAAEQRAEAAVAALRKMTDAAEKAVTSLLEKDEAGNQQNNESDILNIATRLDLVVMDSRASLAAASAEGQAPTREQARARMLTACRDFIAAERPRAAGEPAR